ncbi:MAG: hypothetical protein ACI87W_002207 [Halieaceae bacterium]|jgi:hypothetical protein
MAMNETSFMRSHTPIPGAASAVLSVVQRRVNGVTCVVTCVAWIEVASSQN